MAQIRVIFNAARVSPSGCPALSLFFWQSMAATDQKLLLEKVASFQARAGAARSRVDDLSASLDDASHLLAASDASTGRSAGVSSAVRGAHKLLLDWSLGVVAHLAGALKTKDDAKYAERTATAQAALLDPRLWKVLVKSMDGTARAEGSFSVPQSVGVPLLQAGLYVVHVPVASTAAAQAADWAVKALQAACGLQQQTASNKSTTIPTAAPLHMTLDSFMQLLESAVAQRSAVSATADKPASAAFLTLMLRHAAALQAQQTNQKKVFATACSKVMDLAFEVCTHTCTLYTILNCCSLHQQTLKQTQQVLTAQYVAALNV
jgi:hypothetical protein